MITREALSELMSFHPEHYLTTTLYLEIDGSAQGSFAIRLKYLIKERRSEVRALQPDLRKSVNSDLRKIKEYVDLEFSREGVRTLAIFSCSALKWWKVVTASVTVKSQLAVSSRPYLHPLAFFLDEYSRFQVILIERPGARLFEVYAGEILELVDIRDDVPGKVRVGGFGGYMERRIERHIDDHIRRHFKHVADLSYEFFKKNSNDFLILLGSEQNTNEFQHYLHSTLQEKLVAIEQEEIHATPAQILERATKIEKDLKQKEDRKLLARLFSQVNSGGLGILGLDSTIRALHYGQVNYLVVQEGYGKHGYRCIECSRLLTNNGSCDYCGGKTQAVSNVVDEAIQEALVQGCQVRYITIPDSQLVTAGSIGAMLRYKV